LQIINLQLAVDEPRTVRALHYLSLFRHIDRCNITDKIFQDVVQRHQALHSSVFVNDKGHVRTRLLEHFQKLQGGQALRHEQRWPQIFFEIDLRPGQTSRQEIFGLNDAEDVIQTSLSDREARVER